jgi:hypothetical protein
VKRQLLIPVLLVSALLLSSCASEITFVKRSTNEVGYGRADGMGQKLSASIGSKSCSGDYTTVSSGGGFGLISAYGSGGRVMNATSTWVSLGGIAAGIMKCSDGDVLRCELKFEGTRGYGVCRGGDDQIYDVIAK